MSVLQGMVRSRLLTFQLRVLGIGSQKKTKSDTYAGVTSALEKFMKNKNG